MARPATREAAEAHINAIRKAKGIDLQPGPGYGYIDDLNKALSILSETLYQTSSRFLMEILQNADDCSYHDPNPTIEMTYRHGRLRIDYNEVGFTEADVEAICRLSSTKMASLNQTGEKGIGFKSVFKMSPQVWVLSGHYSFKFDAKRKLGAITPEWEPNPVQHRPGFTSIILPIPEEKKQRELVEDLKRIGSKHVVFLRRLRHIKITVSDGSTWETGINRRDDTKTATATATTASPSNGLRRTIVTSSHDGQTLEYWIYSHVIKNRTQEPRRPHRTESVMTLAFPVRGGANPEPLVERQDVYAVLPIRDYDFRFLVNADFLLVASRQDVDASSQWNEELRASILDAFRGALTHLRTGPLRYTWPRYLSTRLYFSGFFKPIGFDMRQMLSNSSILETTKGDVVRPPLAYYVPPGLRDKDTNTPLTLGPMTESKYLSHQYAHSDWDVLQKFGVPVLTKEGFLDDLERLLAHGSGAAAAEKPEQWHARIAEVLVGLWGDKKHREKIASLPLIPVSSGAWVAASTGNVYFPGIEDYSALGDLGISVIDKDAAENEARRYLFRILGINALSNSTLQSLIVAKHSTMECSWLPSHDILLPHALFLFRTGWSSKSDSRGWRPRFWVATTTDKPLEASEVYLKGEWEYFSHPCFKEFREQFSFIHADYYGSAIRSEDKSRWSNWLRNELGLQDVSQMTPRLQKLILDEHSKADTTHLPAQDLLVSHATFLFQTNWTPVPNTPLSSFYVVLDKGTYVDTRQAVYLDTTTQQSFGKDFEDFRQRFQFLHQKYFSAVKAEKKADWLAWLQKNMRLRDVTELVPALAELTFKECIKPDPSQLPPREVLISRTVVLFRARWKPEKDAERLWVLTEAEKYSPAQEVYLNSTTGRPPTDGGWYGRFRRDYAFLHSDYYHAVEPEEASRWVTWLREQLGLCEVPRLVDPRDPSKLSKDFQQILTRWPTQEILTLLKEKESVYRQFFKVPIIEGKQGGGVVQQPTVDVSTTIQEQIGLAQVRCRDGSAHPLRDTFIISVLPRYADQGIQALHPQLEIPGHAAEWGFLETFGVTVRDDITIYLKTLIRVRGSAVSPIFMAWLYGQIQERDEKTPGALRDIFSAKSIYIEGRWVRETDCIWEGAKFLRKFHVLKRVYPECEQLFTRILTHKSIDIEVLVSEAEAITQAYPVKLIYKIFSELKRHAPRIGPALAKRLRAGEIFPTDEGDAETNFDRLVTGAEDSEWYIADRPHLRDSFRGVVSLLSFPPQDSLRIMPLIEALGLESRLLSRRTTSRIDIGENLRLHNEYTHEFRAKAKVFARMLPRSLSRRDDVLTALDKLQVLTADKVRLQWVLKPITSRHAGLLTKSTQYDEGIRAAVMPPNGSEGIKLYFEHGGDYRLPLEASRRFADICGVEDPANFAYFVFSHSDLAYVERCLERQGLMAMEETDSPDFDFDFDSAQSGADRDHRYHSYHGIADSQQGAAGDNSQQDGDKELSAQKSTDVKLVELPGNAIQTATAMATNKKSVSQTLHRLPLLQAALPHPDYSSLNSHLETPPRAATSSLAGAGSASATKPAAAPLPPLTILGRPKILGTPTVAFVPSRRDLPREDFSQSATGRNVLPARAQISQSGSCTVVIATGQDAESDSDMAFAGELFVSNLLQRYLGSNFKPEVHWTSPLRTRAGHGPLMPSATGPVASFTLREVPAMTDLLIRASFHDARKWKRSCPVYHIQVHTTVGGHNSLFTMHADSLAKARECAVPGPSSKGTSQVFILARVSDLYTSAAGASFYIDPWTMFASGHMKAHPETNSYTAEIGEREPHIRFRDFGSRSRPVTDVAQHRKQRQQSVLTRTMATMTRLIVGRSSYRAKTPRIAEYVYQPLSGRNIRLLELTPGRGLEDLHGAMHHYSLDPSDPPPPFQAISYAWGYSIKPFTLKTPSGTIGITASLCFALRNLRRPDTPIWVWADGICIDQSDDSDEGGEKSCQIRLMPEIFKSAEEVVAWVGEETNNDRDALDYFRKLAAVLEQQEASSSFESESGSGTVSLTIAEDSAMWDSINKFFERPWFHRVWIIQELVFATKVKVVCGKGSAPWDDIYAAAKICSREAQKSSTNVMRHIAKNVSIVIRLGHLRLSYHMGKESERPPLLTLFQSFPYARATRARDKMFALLALASDALDPALNPDYGSTLEQVVQTYARVFVERKSAMQLLQHAGLSSSRFPSWIPDWVTNMPRQTITTWRSKPDGVFSACTLESDMSLYPGDEDKNVLRAKGYVFDTIVQVGETSFQTSDRIEYLQELSQFVRSRPSYPTGEPLKDLEWMIPIGDRIESELRQGGERVDFRSAYLAFTEYLHLGERVTDWKMEIERARAMANMKHFLFQPQELRQLLWPYLQTALDFAERFADARACITAKGYVGIVPGQSEEGDSVVILHGGAVPFIMRRHHDPPGQYVLLGECYVHGIMHQTQATTQDSEVEEIRIR